MLLYKFNARSSARRRGRLVPNGIAEIRSSFGS
jgi:hypothetical protein